MIAYFFATVVENVNAYCWNLPLNDSLCFGFSLSGTAKEDRRGPAQMADARRPIASATKEIVPLARLGAVKSGGCVFSVGGDTGRAAHDVRRARPLVIANDHMAYGKRTVPDSFRPPVFHQR